MPTEIHIGYLPEPKREYIALAQEKAGLGETSHYVVPSTEQVLEVHDHLINAFTGDRMTSTITRPRNPNTSPYANPDISFNYSQIGIADSPIGRLFFSNSGTAFLRRGVTLETNQGYPLCSPRQDLLAGGQPKDEDIQREIALMREVGKNDRIIYLSPFPSHRGKTRREIHDRRSRS